MGKIFYILGKSGTGKDTIYKRICSEYADGIEKIVPYTTRPIRSGETEGNEYHFVDETGFEELKRDGRIIEDRAYNTIHGLWRYFTVWDDKAAESDTDYIMIGVLESYVSIKNHLGSDKLIPIYIELDDGVRLKRALDREMSQAEPKYQELCRRYLADAEDFSEEKIAAAGISRRFYNDDLERVIAEIKGYIDGYKG